MDEQTKRMLLDMLLDISYGFDAYAGGDDDDGDNFWGAWNAMYVYVTDAHERGIADIPDALKQSIYREVEHSFLLSDAAYHIDAFLEANGNDPSLAHMFDREKLVQMFEKYHDCDTAENVSWDYVVRLYAHEVLGL